MANKKSQAAMEFLMTYGWALLMIVTAISALAYFGALNPKDWFSYNYCHIDGGLSCIDHSVEYIPPLPEMHGAVGKNDLVLNVKNNIGWNIEIENSVSRFR